MNSLLNAQDPSQNDITSSIREGVFAFLTQNQKLVSQAIENAVMLVLEDLESRSAMPPLESVVRDVVVDRANVLIERRIDDIVDEEEPAGSWRESLPSLESVPPQKKIRRVSRSDDVPKAMARWTSDESATVRQLYPALGAAPLAKLLGRTTAAIRKHASDIGVVKA